MTAPRSHPNAHILAQLAEIAKTDPEPWKRLEVQIGHGWVKCGDCAPLLNPNAVFRIKPATVNIGGVELEGPLRVAPSNGTPSGCCLIQQGNATTLSCLAGCWCCTYSVSKKGASLRPKRPETSTKTRW